MRKWRNYHLPVLGAALTVLTQEQTGFSADKVEGSFHATWFLTKQLDFPPLAEGVRRDVEWFFFLFELRPSRVVSHSSPSELSAHQMAPAGVIAHRAHISSNLFRAFRLLMLPLSNLSSFVSPLLPLGLGFLLARGYVRWIAFRRIGIPGIAVIRRIDVTGTRIPRLRLLPLPEVRKRP